MTANQNFNLVYGWDAQQLGAAATGLSGYAQPANVPAAPAAGVTAAEQISAGAPGPFPGNVTQILENPGYAASPALMTPGPIAAPSIPATGVAAANTSGLAASVSISGGTVTVVAVAPAGSSTYTTVATSTPSTVTVPPGGSIKMTYSVVPTAWGWTLVS